MIVDFSSPKQLNYNLQCKLKVTHIIIVQIDDK
jgi:hypothetical protein